MYNLGRSISALVRGVPELPELSGTAFVFGAAPNPVLNEELLQNTTIITANASQVVLERFGVTKPHITCMRTNMSVGTKVDIMKLKALRDRQTGLLVLSSHKSDPHCKSQLEQLEKINYQYDDLLILNRTESFAIYNRLLKTRVMYLLKSYSPSSGIRAILLCLAMGAEKVVTTGISFRSDGCSLNDIEYKRIHVDGDLEVFNRIRKLGLPVYAIESALAADAGLKLWPESQKGIESPAFHPA
jgi:hypothetical protein